MILASEFGTGQVFWSILWFFLFLMWFWLVVSVFADILRSRDLSGWGKGLWSVGIIFLPFLGVFLYLIINGDKMNARAEEEAAAADDAMKAYVRDVASQDSNPAEELTKLAELNKSGVLSDDEYAKAKAKAATN